MPDLKDIPASLMSAVKDVVGSNQNLFQQDLERKYGYTPPQEPAVEPAVEPEVEPEVEPDTGTEESPDE